MEIKKYDVRGFRGYSFRDTYDHRCSVQKSSSAEADKIWFGTSTDDLQVGLPWRPLAAIIPAGQSVTGTRMHLSQEQVAELIPILQHFVDTGDLPELDVPEDTK